MRKIKIVADSSSDVLCLENIDFASAPLKIITSEKEFVDNSLLNVNEMVGYFDKYKGKSKTSCPNVSDWLDAFGDADDIFCVTITSGLSGAYTSACVAKEMYEEKNPGKRVFVLDTLSTGPEMRLVISKLEEYINSKMSYEEICEEIQKYLQKTGLLFMLKSLKNFAANGRVSPAIAKITGILDIRIVGRASNTGELEPLDKPRGESNSLKAIVSRLKEAGLSRGKVYIDHCQNESMANSLKNVLNEELPDASVEISECRGLCCYYAEKGGLLVGFEKE